MRHIAIGLALALSGCTLLFGDAGGGDATVDAGVDASSCVLLPDDLDAYPSIPNDAYWVDGVSGSDTNTGVGKSNAWRTLGAALVAGNVPPGATVVLRSDVYTEALHIVESGVQGQPITIMAEENGRAVIDGQDVRVPCVVDGASFIRLIGFHCINSNASAVSIRSNSKDVVLRLITAAGAAVGSPAIGVYDTTDLLLEDLAVAGDNFVLVDLFDNENLEIRRLFALSSSVAPQNYVVQVVDCENCLLQNLVVRGTETANAYGLQLNRTDDLDKSADNTQLLGSLIYKMKRGSLVTTSRLRTMNGPIVRHLVVADSPFGIFQRSGKGFQVQNTNFISMSEYNISVNHNPVKDPSELDADFALSLELSNSILVGGINALRVGDSTFITSLASHANDFFNVDQAYNTGSIEVDSSSILDIDPGFPDNIYGLGAYLMQPAALAGQGIDGKNIGAEILYRYEGGELTNKPLWPWPMEDRIERDLGGYSVTHARFEDDTGGIWNILDNLYPPLCE